jgi:DNA-binding HxlR family transcriptional regulator
MHRSVFEEPGPDSELHITETGKALVGLLFSLAVFATLAIAFWIAS